MQDAVPECILLNAFIHIVRILNVVSLNVPCWVLSTFIKWVKVKECDYERSDSDIIHLRNMMYFDKYRK